MGEVSLDAWVAKPEAVRLTGMNERTLEKKVKAGELRREYRPIPGRKGLPVYHPDDIQKLTERALKPIVLRTPARKPPTVPAPVFTPVYRKVFLTLQEAVDYSGLPKAYLKRCLAEGTIAGAKVPTWRIKREDLQQHRLVANNEGDA
jgi:hypothetical protein